MASNKRTTPSSRSRASSRTSRGSVRASSGRTYASGSRNSLSSSRGVSRTAGGKSARSGFQNARSGYSTSPRVTSMSVGAMSARSRAERVRQSYRMYVIRVCVVLGIVATLIVSGVLVYNSNVFPIKEVTVTGVDHLTSAEMSQIASVPSNTTLLRVDTATIKANILRDAWVQDVDVQRVFPNTLNLAVVEREIGATVQVRVDKGESIERWAISSDGIWLCPIPEEGTEQASLVSPQIYEDAATVFSITDVSYGVIPEVGSACSDESINNAIAIVTGLTTELRDQVRKVSATSTETTTLTLESGVEIAFGKAEDIRTKERVCLRIMEEYPGQVAYINVRVASSPTWRSL